MPGKRQFELAAAVVIAAPRDFTDRAVGGDGRTVGEISAVKFRYAHELAHVVFFVSRRLRRPPLNKAVRITETHDLLLGRDETLVDGGFVDGDRQFKVYYNAEDFPRVNILDQNEGCFSVLPPQEINVEIHLIRVPHDSIPCRRGWIVTLGAYSPGQPGCLVFVQAFRDADISLHGHGYASLLRRAISHPSRRMLFLTLTAWARHFATAVCR